MTICRASGKQEPRHRRGFCMVRPAEGGRGGMPLVAAVGDGQGAQRPNSPEADSPPEQTRKVTSAHSVWCDRCSCPQQVHPCAVRAWKRTHRVSDQ